MSDTAVDHPSVELQAPDPAFPVCSFTIDRPLAAGVLVRLSAGGAQLLENVEITEVRLAGSSEPLEFVHRYDRAEMERNWRWYSQTKSMAVVRLDTAAPTGSQLEVHARYKERRMRGERSGRPSPQQSRDRYSGLSWWMSATTVADEHAQAGEQVAPPFEIRFVPGPPDHIEAYLRNDGRLLVQHFDACGNPTAAAGEVEATANGWSLTAAAASSSGATALGSADAVLAGGRVQVRDASGHTAASNAPPLTFDGTPIFFGEFHWHTEFSGDGQRPVADSLQSARDELALDFAGPTDHLSPGGRYGSRTVADQLALCQPFDEPGRFVAFPAAELSRRYGHANIYTESWELLKEMTDRFAGELAPAWDAQPDRYDLASLVRLCLPGRALVVPHHPNMDSYVREGVVRDDGRPWWCAMHWPIPADRSVIRLVEIVQARGCFETEQTDEDWRIWDGGLGGSVRTALARGYRLGFVGGSDNHSGWPTRKGDGFCGLTAIQAPRLDLSSLFGALHARRSYATTGARIVADVTLNDAPLGSELQLEPSAERRLQIRIHGTAPLQTVQIVHGGYVLAELEPDADSPDMVTEWADERPGRPLEDCYYYVRARQHDGECVWTSPFWIDLPR